MASTLTSTLVNEPFVEPSREQKQEQLLRVLKSRTFQNGPLLQKFLEFIVEKSIEGKPEQLNEYAIATQVLGRRGDFDPASDTSVRTQAYRLRTKLKEYYATEGRSDPFLIDIPKGHYRPTFSVRPDPLADLGDGAGLREQLKPAAPAGIETENHDSEKTRWRFRSMVAILSALAMILFFAGALVGRHWASTELATGTTKIDDSLAGFWRRPSGDGGIVLAFTNPVFLETNTGDLLVYRGGAVADRGALVGKEDSQSQVRDGGLAEHAGPLYYEDGFTGTGEVIAVHRLTDLLRTLDVNLVVERSRVLSAADFHNHDVVFLGSPIGNKILDQIALPKRFTFELPHSSPYLWQEEIVDSKAGTNPTRSYHVERDPQSHVILTDYAFFDVFPSPAPEHRIMLLAGITTTGTQGAATFATSAEGLRQVRDSLGASMGASRMIPNYFECLLRVDAVGGLDALKVNLVSCNNLEGEK